MATRPAIAGLRYALMTKRDQPGGYDQGLG
jgi:hypothetical protein